METVKRSIGLLLLLLAIGLIVGLASQNENNPASPEANTSEQTDASDKNSTTNPETKKEEPNNQPARSESSTASYTYIAQPGDAYAYLARKAVQSYGIVNKVSLSQAQIVAAETRLSAQAGFPELNEGQQITLNPADVKAAVEAARKLTIEQQAGWQAYVPEVDFNTDSNGEVSGNPAK